MSRVRAKPLGWDKAQSENRSASPDPEVPSLEGVAEWVEGELAQHHIQVPKAGINYVKYLVGDVDVDPKSIVHLTGPAKVWRGRVQLGATAEELHEPKWRRGQDVPSPEAGNTRAVNARAAENQKPSGVDRTEEEEDGSSLRNSQGQRQSRHRTPAASCLTTTDGYRLPRAAPASRWVSCTPP